jgi:hypothetical protein
MQALMQCQLQAFLFQFSWSGEAELGSFPLFFNILFPCFSEYVLEHCEISKLAAAKFPHFVSMLF